MSAWRSWTKAARPSAGPDEEGTAAAIYGVIVSSAVMATAQGMRAVAVDLTVLVTLVIYWSAERYSRLIAERIHDGRRPTWREVRGQLTRGWELVTASVLPLIVLTLTNAAGADLSTAILAALGCSTVVLCIAGWEIGRNGQLTTGERIVSAAVAGLFGVAMIALKAFPH